MNFIDISPVINESIGVFPGDVPFKRSITLDFKKGGNLLLSSIESTLHLGAHTDAPNHYDKSGASMDQRSLSYYLGKVQIIEAKSKAKDLRLRVSDFTDQICAPRVLFKTLSYPDPNNFHSHFMSFSPELVDYLAQKKVLLAGIDTPSIDPANDNNLSSHKRIFFHDMAILEGVVLKDVLPGIYTLLALPLKIKNADASPVRAILIEDGGKSLWT